MDFEGVLDDLATDLSDLLWGMLTGIVEVGADLLEAVPVPVQTFHSMLLMAMFLLRFTVNYSTM